MIYMEKGYLQLQQFDPIRLACQRRPKMIKDAKLNPGQIIWRMKDPQTAVTKWKDTKDVILISSMSKPQPSETDFV